MSRHSLVKLMEAIERNYHARTWEEGPGRQWQEAEQRFLDAVPSPMREALAPLLADLAGHNPALHSWLCDIAWDDAYLPEQLPEELLQVYLDHPHADQEYVCEDCGLSIPAFKISDAGARQVAFQPHFAVCPCCAGTPVPWAKVLEETGSALAPEEALVS